MTLCLPCVRGTWRLILDVAPAVSAFLPSTCTSQERMLCPGVAEAAACKFRGEPLDVLLEGVAIETVGLAVEVVSLNVPSPYAPEVSQPGRTPRRVRGPILTAGLSSRPARR